MTDNEERSLEARDTASGELRTVDNTQEEVYALPEKKARRSMIPSILSLILAIVSISTCQIWVLALILALAAFGLALFARYRLGYFDKVALFGLIVSIVGIVFACFSAVVTISGIFTTLA